MGGRTRGLFGFLVVLVVGAQLTFVEPALAATDTNGGFACTLFGFVLRPFGHCGTEISQPKVSEDNYIQNRNFDIKSVVERGLVAGEATSTLSSQVAVSNNFGLSRAEAQSIAESVYEKNKNSAQTHSALMVVLSMLADRADESSKFTAVYSEISRIREALSDTIANTRSDFSGRGGSSTVVDVSINGTLSGPTLSGAISLPDLPTNVILFTDSAGEMTGVASLGVDDSGNLLIGTTTAQERLTVDGAVYLADSAPATTGNRLYSVAGSLYWNGSIVVASSSGNWTGSGGNVYRNTGFVGIGTSSPFAELSVVGDIALTGGLYDSSASLGTAGMVLQTTGTGVNWVATSTLGFAGGADISASSIQDLLDVATLTEDTGDLLYWNGTAWADIATSALDISTNNVIEDTNLFYTDARVASYINGSSTIYTTPTEAGLEAYLSDVTNVFTNNDGALSDDDLSDNSTSDLAEGTNQYYTLARFAAALAGTSTDALGEGSGNLYYTDARVASYILGSSTVSLLGQLIDESELNISGAPTDGYVLQASSTSAGGFVWVATSTLGIVGTGGAGTSTFAGLTDTPSSFTTGDIFYASNASTISALSAGGDGMVLKMSGGVPTWGADIGGSGGSGAWATSTNNLFVYPADPSDVIIVGGSATTATGYAFEVVGNMLTRGITASSATTSNLLVTLNADIDGTLDVDGLVALGNAATGDASRRVNLIDTVSTNNNYYSIFNNPRLTATLSNSRSGYGSYNLFEADAITESLSDYTAVAVYGEVQIDGSSSVGSARAGQFIVDYNAPTLGDNAYTISSTLEVGGGAVIGNGYGYFSDLVNGGTINNYYGIFLQDVAEGVMGNAYAFWTNSGDMVLDGDGNGVAGGSDAGSDLFFGEGQDAAIWYDGTNFNINPRISGTGNTILPAGRLGIGTTSPYASLSISGDLAVTGGLYDNNSTRGTNGQLLQSSGTGIAWVGTSTLGINTTNVIEGTNLFYTDARVASYINGSTTIYTTPTEAGLETFLSDVSNVFTNNDGALSDDDLSDNSTSDLAEGTNQYFTLARFAAALAGTSTDALPQGSTNLYYTDAYVDVRLSATTSLPNITSLANLTTVGTIGAGAWQGTAVGLAYGGTGLSSFTTGDILYAASSTALNTLGVGGEGSVLKISGGIPFWGTDLSGDTAIWASSTNGQYIYPADPNDIVLVGTTATSAPGYMLEINGNALVAGLQTTNATTSRLSLGSDSITDITGDGLAMSGNSLSVSCAALEGTGVTCLSNNFVIDFTDFDADSITEGSTNQFAKWTELFNKLYYTPAFDEYVGIGDSDPDSTFEVAGTIGNGYFAVSSAADSDGNIFTIDSSGDVGIGTNNPGDKLHISGGNLLLDNTQSIRGYNNTASINTLFAYSSSNDLQIGSGIGNNLELYGKVDTIFYINGEEVARFDANGDFSIGDPTPDYKFELVGTSTSGRFAISSTTDGDIFQVSNNGFIGVGTSAPSHRLTIAGDVFITGGLFDNNASSGSSGQILRANGSGGFTWTSTSSLSLNTTDLIEGSNLFYTDSRVASYINASTTILNSSTEAGLEAFINDALDVFTDNDLIGVSNGGTGIPILTPGTLLLASTTSSFTQVSTSSLAINTDDLVEGSTNLFTPWVINGSTISYSGGPVGIGTTTPSADFALAGDFFLEGGLYDNSGTRGISGQILQTNGSGISWVGTSTLGFNESLFTDSGSATYLTSLTDSLGIGTTTPTRLLHVYGNVSAGGRFTDSTNYVSVEIFADDTTGKIGTVSNNDLRFVVNDNTTMTIDTSGNVGIGTTTPDAKLTVSGDLNLVSASAGIKFDGIQILYSSSTNDSIALGELAGTAGTFNNIIGYSAGTNNTGDVNNLIGTFAGLNNTGSYNELIGLSAGRNNAGDRNQLIGSGAGYYLNASGTVAIGSESLFGNNGGGAGAVYQALNNVAIGYRAGYNATTSASNNILIGYQVADSLTSGSNNIVIGYDVEAPNNAGSNQLNIGNILFGTGLNATGTTVSTGNIGIRNIAPAVALHIGSTSVTDSTSLLRLEDANSTCNFNADTGSPSCGSDIRLKKDVAIVEDELRRIVALEPSAWRWKTDASNAPLKTGFIAQEVEKEFPDLVTESLWIDGSTKKFLNVGGLMPYVVGAVKEQQETLEEMMITGSSTRGTSSPFYMMFDGEEDTVWEKLVSLARGFGDGILTLAGLHTVELYARDIEAETITTETLCIGNTCVTESELQDLLQGTGSSVVQTTSSNSTNNENTNTSSVNNSESPVSSGNASSTSTSTNTGGDISSTTIYTGTTTTQVSSQGSSATDTAQATSGQTDLTQETEETSATEPEIVSEATNETSEAVSSPLEPESTPIDMIETSLSSTQEVSTE